MKKEGNEKMKKMFQLENKCNLIVELLAVVLILHLKSEINIRSLFHFK